MRDYKQAVNTTGIMPEANIILQTPFDL